MQLGNLLVGRFWGSLILIGLLPCLSGCFTVKVRHLRWPGLRVRREGPLINIGDIPFYIVYFDVKSDTVEFSVRMPDGHVLTSDQMTPQALAPYATPTDQLVREVHPSWSDHLIVEYENGSIRVRFDENRLKRVAIFVRQRWGMANESRPAIGNATGDKIFSMPVTERQLVELFGEPSSARSYLFNT